MAPRTTVYIACSPHARAGVSTTARLLTDFNHLQERLVEGFDSDPHEPFYGALFPQCARMVDINSVKGQISLFDSLLIDNGLPKIVDVWHRSYNKFFGTIQEIGFFEEAQRIGVEPIVLFHADATERALAEAAAINEAWPDLTIRLVHNEGAAPIGPHSHEVLAHYPAHGKFIIPTLDPSVAPILQNRSLSLSQFLLAPSPEMSIVVRAALKGWVTRVFTQFQSFELRAALEDAVCLR